MWINLILIFDRIVYNYADGEAVPLRFSIFLLTILIQSVIVLALAQELSHWQQLVFFKLAVCHYLSFRDHRLLPSFTIRHTCGRKRLMRQLRWTKVPQTDLSCSTSLNGSRFWVSVSWFDINGMKQEAWILFVVWIHPDRRVSEREKGLIVCFR